MSTWPTTIRERFVLMCARLRSRQRSMVSAASGISAVATSPHPSTSRRCSSFSDEPSLQSLRSVLM